MSAAWQTPLVLLAVMAWLAAPPKSLGEASQREAIRRQTVGKSRTVLTNIGQPAEIPLVAPAATPPAAGDAPAGAAAAAAAGSAAPAPAEKAKDEKYWRDRIATANDKINRDVMMSQALQTRINTLKRDSVNLDDPGKQRKAREELQLTLDELDRNQKLIDVDRKELQAIQDDARRQNVPAGWIR